MKMAQGLAEIIERDIVGRHGIIDISARDVAAFVSNAACIDGGECLTTETQLADDAKRLIDNLLSRHEEIAAGVLVNVLCVRDVVPVGSINRFISSLPPSLFPERIWGLAHDITLVPPTVKLIAITKFLP